MVVQHSRCAGLGALLGAWLAVALGCGSDSPGLDTQTRENAPAPGELALEIAYPFDGQRLSGSTPVILSLPQDAAIESLWLGVDEREPSKIQRPRAVVNLATRSFPNGSHELWARVQLDSGQVLEDRIAIDVDNALHRLVNFTPDRLAYANGSTISLALGYSEPGLSLGADFAPLDANFDASRVRFEDQGDGRYRLEYEISGDNPRPDGSYLVELLSTNAAGRTNVDYVPVRLRQQPTLPIQVVGGVFVDGAAPSQGPGEDAPEMTGLAGGETLLSGGQVQLEASWAPEQPPVDRLLISVEGYAGYYVKPVARGSDASDQLTVTLPFLPGQFDGSSLTLRVAGASLDGSVSNWLDEAVTAVLVSEAGVQATLTWNSSADLDLTVRTPSTARIDFENRLVDGGSLDLDANALCEASAVTAEHVGWPRDERVVGPYEIYVNMYDACGAGPTEWTLVAQFCGETRIERGVFAPGDATPGVDGIKALDFDVDCTHAVSGKVEYQTVASLEQFFTPAPFVPVRVVPASGGEPLAETLTDAFGNYRLDFTSPASSDYRVEIPTEWRLPESDEVLVEVTPQTQTQAHVIRSEVLPGAEANAVQDFRVARADGGGALSIVNAARRGYSWLIAFVSDAAVAGKLRIRWEMGSDESTRYDFNRAEVFISSTERQIDDTDPSVVAHEFMHWAHDQLSHRSDASGGHFGKSPAPLAFKEGLATVYAQQALGSPEYISLGEFWIIEDLEIPFAMRAEIDLDSLPPEQRERAEELLRDSENVLDERRGTRTRIDDDAFILNQMDGDVSEMLVAMIVWDMFDPANEPHDRLSAREAAVNHSLFFYLSRDVFDASSDRGAEQQDFVDFLDGYLQFQPGDEANVLRLTTEREFPYELP